MNKTYMDKDLDISDITSLAASLLYDCPAIKAGRCFTKTCANSTQFDLQFFAPSLGTTTMLQSRMRMMRRMMRMRMRRMMMMRRRRMSMRMKLSSKPEN